MSGPVRESDLLWTPGSGAHRERAPDALSTLAREGARPQVRQLRRAVALVGHGSRRILGRTLELLQDRRLRSPTSVCSASRKMPGAEWFPGARINFAQHILRNERPGAEALLHLSERSPLTELSWTELGAKVRILATELRRLGVQPGDRVAAYLPNIPEAVIAMLATTSIGAIWSSCGPDFGPRGVLDRFTQLAPKVLFCVDGYQYAGKPFDRRPDVREFLRQLEIDRARGVPAVSRSRGSHAALDAHTLLEMICSTNRRSPRRISSSSRYRSSIRSGSCFPRARRDSRRRSCMVMAAC